MEEHSKRGFQAKGRESSSSSLSFKGKKPWTEKKEKGKKEAAKKKFPPYAHFTGNKSELIEDFKKHMQDVFEITDLGLMTYFLGMEVNQNEQGIFIIQQAFALKILSKFSMSKCKPASTPVALGEKLSSTSEHDRVDEKAYRSLVGCPLYLTAIRPDIIYVVSLLSRFMHCCNVAHFKATKTVLRYVK
ncbi:hypothetical protein PVK06_007241 [Gossypium arboreum]|uniref:Reverse transcriptase Ty1/copia-type domain-containing protein n=1 Tax=Gossypium arboreum TaxID=29729 RepID=A0ABR0QGS6_GOSAR|nr:hypothetical protein PVK06_007241 [Gossypium arboreum]